MSYQDNAATSKRIGLLDYRLDNFHADVFTAAIRAVRQQRGYEIAGAYALQRWPSVCWAENNGVPYYDELDTLCSNVDVLMILAPSHPECHLELCQRVFPLRKQIYVDKTFAPDLATAETIFAMADRHHVAVQTSSALRYTGVQTAFATLGGKARNLTVWGGGSSFAEYGIHVVEMAVSCLGPNANDMIVLGSDAHPVIVLQYDAGRTATIHMNAESHAPFRAVISTESTTELLSVDETTLFTDATTAILDFFDAGVAQIDRRESLLIRQVLDVVAARHAVGRVVSLQPNAKKSQVPVPKGFGSRTAPLTNPSV